MNIKLLPVLVAASVLAVAGCKGGSGSANDTSSPGNPDGAGDQTAKACSTDAINNVTTCTLDATDYDHYVYYRFGDDKALTLTDTQAPDNGNWDIAFRRSTVKTNGGSSSNGIGKIEGALVVPQDDFYDVDGEPIKTKFINANPESELSNLTGTWTAPASWSADKVTSALAPDAIRNAANCQVVVSPPQARFDFGWYIYNGGCVGPGTHGPHSIYANPDNGWLLRSEKADSYAKFRATNLSVDSQTSAVTATFDLSVQLANSSGFSESRTWQVNNQADGTSSCYDFDTGTAGDCSGATWDIKLTVDGRDIYLRTNSGPNGAGDAGAFGPLPWTEVANYTNGTSDPTGAQPLAMLYVPDANSSIVDLKSWYAYDLQGQHRLWPNYRVYEFTRDPADSSAKHFAMQITSYYDKLTGDSGHITFRYRELAAPASNP